MEGGTIPTWMEVAVTLSTLAAPTSLGRGGLTLTFTLTRALMAPSPSMLEWCGSLARLHSAHTCLVTRTFPATIDY